VPLRPVVEPKTRECYVKTNNVVACAQPEKNNLTWSIYFRFFFLYMAYGMTGQLGRFYETATFCRGVQTAPPAFSEHFARYVSLTDHTADSGGYT